jgi:hypothetical protein
MSTEQGPLETTGVTVAGQLKQGPKHSTYTESVMKRGEAKLRWPGWEARSALICVLIFK